MSYFPLVYHEFLLLSIFFHFEVYMIENESFWEVEACLFHTDNLKIFADQLKTSLPCGSIRRTYTRLLKVKRPILTGGPKYFKLFQFSSEEPINSENKQICYFLSAFIFIYLFFSFIRGLFSLGVPGLQPILTYCICISGTCPSCPNLLLDHEIISAIGNKIF